MLYSSFELPLLLKICAITPTHQLTGTTPNILNRCSEKNRQSVDVSLDELYNYFKEMNEVENDDIEIVINLNEDNHE
jgi:hypothetical protein